MIIKDLEIRKSLAAMDVFIKGNHLANIGAYNQRHVSNCVITIFSYEKSIIFLTSRKYVHCKIKLSLKTLMIERAARQVVFNLTGYKKSALTIS